MITQPGLLAAFIILAILLISFIVGYLVFYKKVYKFGANRKMKNTWILIPKNKKGKPSNWLRFKLWLELKFNIQERKEYKEYKKQLAARHAEENGEDLEEEKTKKKNSSWFDDLCIKLTNLLDKDLEVKRLFSNSNLNIDQPLPEQLKKFPEEIARAKTIFFLNEKYGIDYDQMEFELPVRIGSKNYFVDISIFPKNLKHILDHALIHVECKKGSADTETINGAIDQLKSYMQVSPITKYGFISTGEPESFKFFEKDISLSGIEFKQVNNFLNGFDFRLPTSADLNKGGDLDW